MPKLRHPNGATVEVPAEKAPRLLRTGFALVEKPAPKKAVPRKTAAKKPEIKLSDDD